MENSQAKNENKFRSGYVALIGLPNVGKSTLLNQLLGYKVAIATPKPQTTRFPIRGVLTGENFQIIFVDTPGIHDAKDLFNKIMVEQALKAIEEVDSIVFIIDVSNRNPKAEEKIIDILRKANKPAILALNKIDLVKKGELLPIIDYFSQIYPFKAIVPISALERDGLEELVKEIVETLPEGPMYYDPDTLTDQPQRLLAAEIIREKVFMLTRQEIPYATAVVVEEFQEDPERNLIIIQATIYVEKDSQKGIVIGKGGQMLKKIGTLAREELEFLFGKRVHLDLWVKVLKGWRKEEKLLRRLGFPGV
ncbi:GTP-binding protein Era [Thermodesulfatator indicus DSM 15286]|uniref:GTPase Era n=1 Tax=Thermodesulfatator indicus (strain DSM 15286 / JCM 11887 / CIR29812) TaxID=667014 RepID=F8ADI5_THEID|nr:GTPase Era [Thermodesulfatator indicus]AEH44859.1 GTP-binding protein Era [Thermodesulfatator indicus DSM 15286]